MGFSSEEFWDTNPILFYLLVEHYNNMNASKNIENDKKVYYKEEL